MELTRVATINNVAELAPVYNGRQSLCVQLIVPSDAGAEILEIAEPYTVAALLAAFGVATLRDLRGQRVVVVTDDVSGFVHGFAATSPEPTFFPKARDLH